MLYRNPGKKIVHRIQCCDVSRMLCQRQDVVLVDELANFAQHLLLRVFTDILIQCRWASARAEGKLKALTSQDIHYIRLAVLSVQH